MSEFKQINKDLTNLRARHRLNLRLDLDDEYYTSGDYARNEKKIQELETYIKELADEKR